MVFDEPLDSAALGSSRIAALPVVVSGELIGCLICPVLTSLPGVAVLVPVAAEFWANAVPAEPNMAVIRIADMVILRCMCGPPFEASERTAIRKRRSDQGC